jgi:hypothetical protein
MKKGLEVITKRLVKLYTKYKEELKQTKQEIMDLNNFYRKDT